MKKKAKRKITRASRTTIVIAPQDFDILWKAKERFRGMVRGRTTWTSFLSQAVLFLEAQHFLPSVKATRYNPYVYAAICPYCGVEASPLRRRREIIWKIKCSHCDGEYIALA